jgi:hypothetical protein
MSSSTQGYITSQFRFKTLPIFAIVKYNYNKTQHE